MSKEQTLNFDDYDTDGLRVLKVEVLTEIERRERIEELPAQIEALTQTYQAAAGIADGTEYVPPTHAGNAVPAGGTRVFSGDLWENTSGVPLAHSPVEYPAGWTKVEDDVDPIVPDPEEYPEWSPDAVAYTKDTSVVSYAGKVYSCAQDHVSQAGWTPPVVPALWNLIG